MNVFDLKNADFVEKKIKSRFARRKSPLVLICLISRARAISDLWRHQTSKTLCPYEIWVQFVDGRSHRFVPADDGSDRDRYLFRANVAGVFGASPVFAGAFGLVPVEIIFARLIGAVKWGIREQVGNGCFFRARKGSRFVLFQNSRQPRRRTEPAHMSRVDKTVTVRSRIKPYFCRSWNK